MAPREGYWRSNKYTDKFLACPNPDACIGSDPPPNLNYLGNCATGYTGNLCQSCAEGYSRSYGNTCGSCPDHF